MVRSSSLIVLFGVGELQEAMKNKAIDQYYWLGYYDSFIRFCGEGNCTFDLGWIDRNSLHFIDFGLWNLLYLCIL